MHWLPLQPACIIKGDSISQPDEHIIEAIGKSRIIVSNGKVQQVTFPILTDCPLARRFACPVAEMSEDAVIKNIANRISAFGMCTPSRNLYDDEAFVGFGASELMSSGIRSGMLDCAVIACDGAGTVLVTDPRMVQGIGGRMSGLVRTTPYPRVVTQIVSSGGRVLDEKTGLLDPAAGVSLAIDLGFKRPAVTVAYASDAEKVRNAAENAVIIAVHTTGISERDLNRFNEVCDIITGCASQAVRDISAPKSCLQAGTTVPVFAMTSRGKNLILERMKELPYPLLVTHATLPVGGQNQPTPLV